MARYNQNHRNDLVNNQVIEDRPRERFIRPYGLNPNEACGRQPCARPRRREEIIVEDCDRPYGRRPRPRVREEIIVEDYARPYDRRPLEEIIVENTVVPSRRPRHRERIGLRGELVRGLDNRPPYIVLYLDDCY
jgi:hypothetical protein